MASRESVRLSPSGGAKAGALIHRTTRDLGGNVLKEEILAGDNTASNLLSQSTYDLLGRTLRRTDARGLGTAHEYLDAGRTNVARQIHLAANGAVTTNATETAVRHRDGRTMQSTRDGAPATTFAYAVATDGVPAGWCRLRTTVHEGPLGAASPVWSRTTSDFLGRTLLEERPGFSVGSVPSVVQTLHQYEPATGRLLSTTQSTVVSSVPSVLSVVLHSYDSLGERYRTTQDLDLDGVVDLAGPDRVTDTHTEFVQLDGVWWQESRQYVYPADATPKLVSTQRQRLTGLGTAVPGGILVAESVSIDILGNATASRTVLDRAARRVVQTSDGPASTLDALTVSVNGLVLSNVTATGVTTLHAYDPLGRRILSSTASAGGTRAVASASGFDTLGQLAWTADAAGTTNRFVYDPFTGRRVAVTNALAQATHTAYDPEGRVAGTWGSTYPVFYAYDPYGRMAAMYTLRDSSLQIESHADFLANKVAFDQTTWLYHEPTGLLTNKFYADGKGTAYSYTPDGKLATRTWARRSPVTGLACQTLYSYDAAHSLTAIAYSDSTPAVTFAYDRLGRQTNVIQSSTGVPPVVHQYAYDAATLALASETIIDLQSAITNVLSRSTDTLGRPAGLEVGRGVPAEPSPYAVAYGYDQFGRFQSVQSAQSADTNTWTYTYLPGSHLLVSVSNDLGMVAARSYEPHRDLIAAVSNTFGGTLVSAFDYANDALGRRTARLDVSPVSSFQSPVTNSFGYNARSEVQSALMGTNVYGYAYDPIGNRVVATNNAEALRYAANALNQYTNITDGVTLEPAYDEDGNMTATGDGWHYVWNGENRLVLASNGTVRVAYLYDHQGRMFWKQVSRLDLDAWNVEKTLTYLWDNYNIIRETEVGRSSPSEPLSTNVTYNVWGIDLRGALQGAGGIGGLLSVTTSAIDPVTLQPSSPVTSFPAFDGNGNITEYLSSTGTVVAHYEYSPFGELTAQIGSLADRFTHRFSTKPWCEVTGLSEYELRNYSSRLGRWVNRDPIEEQGGIGLYNHCLNSLNGLILGDMLGLDPIPTSLNAIPGAPGSTCWRSPDGTQEYPHLADGWPVDYPPSGPYVPDTSDGLSFTEGALAYYYGDGAPLSIPFHTVDPGWHIYEMGLDPCAYAAGTYPKLTLRKTLQLYGLGGFFSNAGPGRILVTLVGELRVTVDDSCKKCWYFDGRMTAGGEPFNFDPSDWGIRDGEPNLLRWALAALETDPPSDPMCRPRGHYEPTLYPRETIVRFINDLEEHTPIRGVPFPMSFEGSREVWGDGCCAKK